MSYRNMRYQKPADGEQLPAFIVSEYEQGDLLVFSHGKFDIWCVYHAIKLNDDAPIENKRAKKEYPLTLDSITVETTIGTNKKTIDTGIFVEYAITDFKFDAPTDNDYMQEIRNLASKYGQNEVWRSFLKLYDSIPQQRGVAITRTMTRKVSEIVAQYPCEKNLRLTFDCLLCAMIAENNREKTKLGKKIKALGIYQSIYELHLSIPQVTNYSKNKSWQWISKECQRRGITTPDL